MRSLSAMQSSRSALRDAADRARAVVDEARTDGCGRRARGPRSRSARREASPPGSRERIRFAAFSTRYESRTSSRSRQRNSASTDSCVPMSPSTRGISRRIVDRHAPVAQVVAERADHAVAERRQPGARRVCDSAARRARRSAAAPACAAARGPALRSAALRTSAPDRRAEARAARGAIGPRRAVRALAPPPRAPPAAPLERRARARAHAVSSSGAACSTMLSSAARRTCGSPESRNSSTSRCGCSPPSAL